MVSVEDRSKTSLQGKDLLHFKHNDNEWWNTWETRQIAANANAKVTWFEKSFLLRFRIWPAHKVTPAPFLHQASSLLGPQEVSFVHVNKCTIVGEISQSSQEAARMFSDSAASVCRLVDLIDTVFAVGTQGAHLPISPVGFIICRWWIICLLAVFSKYNNLCLFSFPSLLLQQKRFVDRDVENNILRN